MATSRDGTLFSTGGRNSTVIISIPMSVSMVSNIFVYFVPFYCSWKFKTLAVIMSLCHGLNTNVDTILRCQMSVRRNTCKVAMETIHLVQNGHRWTETDERAVREILSKMNGLRQSCGNHQMTSVLCICYNIWLFVRCQIASVPWLCNSASIQPTMYREGVVSFSHTLGWWHDLRVFLLYKCKTRIVTDVSVDNLSIISYTCIVTFVQISGKLPNKNLTRQMFQLVPWQPQLVFQVNHYRGWCQNWALRLKIKCDGLPAVRQCSNSIPMKFICSAISMP